MKQIVIVIISMMMCTQASAKLSNIRHMKTKFNLKKTLFFASYRSVPSRVLSKIGMTFVVEPNQQIVPDPISWQSYSWDH